MEFWDNFWSIFWFGLFGFALVAYLMTLFSIITDLFRDRGLGGGPKALWFIFLLFIPFLTAVAYLITRGEGMAERNMASAKASQQAADDYIRSVSGSSSADEITKAQALLDSGVITPAEFESLKSKALSS